VDSSPAVGAGLVIYGTQSDSVVALAAGTGKVVWQSPTTSAVESAPVIAAGTVYVGSDNGTVYALNEATGALKWQVVLSGAIKGSPSVDTANGKLVVGDSSGAVTALSSTNGSTLWSKATGGPVTATPMIYTGAVYVGSQSGSVFAFNETTGAVNWTFKAAGPISASGAFWTDGAKPSYLAGDNKGDVYFLSVTNGSINRQINDVASPITGLSAAYGWAVISTANGAVYADKFPGEITWLFQATKQLSPATMVNGVLYVSGQDAAVRAFTVPGTQIP
jgi:outer membrane protein assembly factor BamB